MPLTSDKKQLQKFLDEIKDSTIIYDGVHMTGKMFIERYGDLFLEYGKVKERISDLNKPQINHEKYNSEVSWE
jgi:hypothetical protein